MRDTEIESHFEAGAVLPGPFFFSSTGFTGAISFTGKQGFKEALLQLETPFFPRIHSDPPLTDKPHFPAPLMASEKPLLAPETTWGFPKREIPHPPFLSGLSEPGSPSLSSVPLRLNPLFFSISIFEQETGFILSEL